MKTLLLSTFAAMAVAQCPTGTQNTSITDVCKNVSTFNKSLSEMSAKQPNYFFVLPNKPKFSTLDNVCFTLFPTPDGLNTFIIYVSFVYCNGTNLIETYSANNQGDSISIWASYERTFAFYNLECVGCGSYAVYGCPLFGDSMESVCVIGPGAGSVGNGTGALTPSCVENAKQAATSNGLDSHVDDFYVLPYTLPTRCVTTQPCVTETTGSCVTY